MADGTGIEWTDATWNPITGCAVKSPGCINCYAMELAGTRLRNHPSRAGLTREVNGKHVWTGEVRFNEGWLDQPLRWSRPRNIFVVAHGDLFHERVTFGQVMRVFDVMTRCPWHRLQILTKRPERTAEFCARWADLNGEGFEPKLARGPDATRAAHPSGRGQLFADMLEAMGTPPPGAAYPTFDWAGGMIRLPDAFRHIWIGTSVERQQEADERRPHLERLAAMGWNTWVSYEPALGPVDWSGWEFVRWMVSGGESDVRGRARPSHPDWHRATRDWCALNSIAYFFKQWGDWREFDHGSPDVEIDVGSEHAESVLSCAIRPGWITRDGRFFGDQNDLPDDTLCRLMERIGKKAAGALLDGREHKEMP